MVLEQNIAIFISIISQLGKLKNAHVYEHVHVSKPGKFMQWIYVQNTWNATYLDKKWKRISL